MKIVKMVETNSCSTSSFVMNNQTTNHPPHYDKEKYCQNHNPESFRCRAGCDARVVRVRKNSNALASPDQTTPVKPRKHSNPHFHGKAGRGGHERDDADGGHAHAASHARHQDYQGRPSDPAVGWRGWLARFWLYKKTDGGKLNAVTVHFGVKRGKQRKESSNN